METAAITMGENTKCQRVLSERATKCINSNTSCKHQAIASYQHHFIISSTDHIYSMWEAIFCRKITLKGNLWEESLHWIIVWYLGLIYMKEACRI